MELTDILSSFTGQQLAVYHAARKSLREHGHVSPAVLRMHSVLCKAIRKERPAKGHEYPKGTKLSKPIRELFTNQGERVQAKVDKFYGKKDAAYGDPLPPDDFFEDFLFNPEEIEVWVKRTKSGFTAYVEWGGNRAAAKLGTGFDVEPFNVKQSINQAVFNLSSNANQVTQAQLDKMIPKLKQSVERGLLKGTSYDAMSKDISRLFGKQADFRTDRIAKTEAVRAVNVGHMEAMKQSGVVVGKRWGLSGDPCEICVAIKAEDESRQAALSIDGPFGKVSEHPDYGIVFAPPAHPNCQCYLEEVLYDAPPGLGFDNRELIDDYAFAAAT